MTRRRSTTKFPKSTADNAEECTADGCSTSGVDDSYTARPSRFLCYFCHRLLDFRVPEVNALAELVGCGPQDVKWESPYGGGTWSPFWYLTLPSHAAAIRIAQRSVLIRSFFELWGEGSTWEELQTALEAYPKERSAPWLQPDVTFKVVVDTWGFKLPLPESLDLIKRLEFVGFKGKVDLRNPQQLFWLMVVDERQQRVNGLPNVPRRFYFGRQIAAGDRFKYSHTYSLRTRAYLGPTSMDAEMAFIMCNQAQVGRGQLVFDPYVGTGSILVAAAACGAHVMGSDIDIRVIKLGKESARGHVNVFSNFKQYGLGWPAGMLRMDAAAPPFRAGLSEVFDAVVADPPYGVRAGGRKSVAKPNHMVHYPETHIPSTAPYSLTECLNDLLDLAARLLRVGGRVVFFVPATPDTYREEELPCHPALKMVANSEQLLTQRYSRRLITMQKVAVYDAATADAWREARRGFVMAIERVPDIVYAPLVRGSGADDEGGSADERGCGLKWGRADAEEPGRHAVHYAEYGSNKQPFRGKMC